MSRNAQKWPKLPKNGKNAQKTKKQEQSKLAYSHLLWCLQSFLMAEKYPELVGLSENSKIKQKLAISWTQRECKNYQARGIFPQWKQKVGNPVDLIHPFSLPKSFNHALITSKYEVSIFKPPSISRQNRWEWMDNKKRTDIILSQKKSLPMGWPSVHKWMFFWKSSERGGGPFPIQKIALQILLVSKRYILVVNFGKKCPKMGGSSQIQKISLQIYAS